MITKFFNSGGFALIMVCFLLPFLSIKCNDKKLFEFSGADLAFGTTYKMDNPLGDLGKADADKNTNADATAPADNANGATDKATGENQEKKDDKDKLEPNPIMIFVLAIALIGVILSFAVKKGLNLAALICAVLIAGSIFYVSMEFKNAMGTAAGGGEYMAMLKVGHEIGFWLILGLSVALIAYNIIDMIQNSRKRDITPVI